MRRPRREYLSCTNDSNKLKRLLLHNISCEVMDTCLVPRPGHISSIIKGKRASANEGPPQDLILSIPVLQGCGIMTFFSSFGLPIRAGTTHNVGQACATDYHKLFNWL